MGTVVVVLPKYASFVGVVTGSLSLDISKKTHPADDPLTESIDTVVVHVCVWGVDWTSLHGDPTVPSDFRDAVMVIPTKCEALDGTTVLGHSFEVSVTSCVKCCGMHNTT